MKGLRTHELYCVEKKNVLVSGGGRGIGKMVASGFVANGCTVFITSRRLSTCETTAKELTDAGPGRCIAIQGDLSKPENCRGVVEEIQRHVDNIHVLVNNSGATWGEPLESYPPSAWDKLWDINVKAVFYLTKECLPLLRKAATKTDPGRVINIGSVDGVRVTFLSHYAYSTSKSAVHQLSRVLARELAPMITVNAIAAGPFATKMTKGVFDAAGGVDNIGTSTPMQRVGSASDIAGTVMFLSSPAGAWITGAIVPVDGGILVKPAL